MRKSFYCTLVFIFYGVNLIAQNVGIGTSTPADKLSVVTTQQGYGISHSFGTVSLGTYLTTVNAQFGTRTNHPLHFFTNNSAPQVTLLPSGNLGIGTISPAVMLDVVGNVLSEGLSAGFRFNDRADNTKGYQWYANAGNAYLYRHHATPGNTLSVLANGNMGLNIDVPQTDLHINPNGAGSILIGTNKSSGGFTNVEMGITSQSGGNSYIQSTRSSGSAPGDLYLNPNSGYVGINNTTNATLFAPLDINQSSSLRGIRLRNNLTLFSSNIWDMYVDNQLHFNEGGFHVAYIGDDGTWNQVSDARLKTGIIKMGTVLDKVMALQPKKYQYIHNNSKAKFSSGFLAQEVMEIFPDLVSDFKHFDEDSSDNTIYHGINYSGFGVIAIKAIQEQQHQIEEVKDKNNRMMELIVKMQLDIEALRQKIKGSFTK